MQHNLVIVESPTKAKTIEKFLGEDFKVMSSEGHIRDLKKRGMSLDEKSMEPEYEIPRSKQKVVNELKAAAKKVDKVWLASDEDREGEAISWHLCEVLGLDVEKTSRIVFHEITKNAILGAVQSPRQLDMNLVYAQQARRVLDRLVGFKISPILWKKIKPSLSAGRVQSVAVRLLVEKEREISKFKTEPYFRVVALFDYNGTEVKAVLANRLTVDDAEAFMEKCRTATFTVSDIQQKPTKRTPPPPFTTSTLQQDASRRLGMSVSQVMSLAQKLYEAGKITYMRTDSVNLSSLCINTAKQEIINRYGEEYSRPRQFHTNAKGAQEAHEAIRPSYIDKATVAGTPQEKKLYDIIWKRTVASQMAEAEIERTTITIKMDNSDEVFIARGEVITFEGFMKVFRETVEENADDETSGILPKMNVGDALLHTEIVATEKYTMPPLRYTEATLVHKLEELGIGRPSTYAPIISTIQQREYVAIGNKQGEDKEISIYTLKNGNIKKTTETESVGADKKKLMPTDIGVTVNDFLVEYFPDIMDYNFTAKVENQFDKIAEGNEQWRDMMIDFNKNFAPIVDKVINMKSDHKVGERELGIDPKSGKPIFVKIGRFGPVVQMGNANDEDKPKFAQMPKDKTMETLTLEEAVELFRLPRELGEFEGSQVVIGAGKFGPYIFHKKKYISLPKDEDPMTVTYDKAVELIVDKREVEKQKVIKVFDEAKLQVLNGMYGPYIKYRGRNFSLTKKYADKVEELTLDDCMQAINETKKKS
ncbi:MAG: type I DNA topoisomerase [Prevotellaceae bacterium]|nr:type I DNA topoisomerase [Prevotellaceae bacterium]